MRKDEDKYKLIELTINQNLLLWQLSKSLLDLDKKIIDSVKTTRQT